MTTDLLHQTELGCTINSAFCEQKFSLDGQTDIYFALTALNILASCQRNVLGFFRP